MMCASCRGTLDYVHGHAACLDNRCPQYGRNQAECCGGETAGQCPVPASEIAALPPRDRPELSRPR